MSIAVLMPLPQKTTSPSPYFAPEAAGTWGSVMLRSGSMTVISSAPGRTVTASSPQRYA
jgi:hypothetical protein